MYVSRLKVYAENAVLTVVRVLVVNGVLNHVRLLVIVAHRL